MRRLIYVFFFIFFTAFSTHVQTTDVEEYNFKAVFIYNFTKYINWGPFTQGNEFTIGILGNSPIALPLAEIARTRTVDNKKIVIHQFKHAQDITFTNILFISRSVDESPGAVLPKVAAGTLTVSERDGMAEDGMAFNFVIDGNKLKFEANVKAIASAGLKASSELLQHAILVNQ